MKAACKILMAFLAAAATAWSAPSEPAGVLRWRSGESLPGQIESATDTALTWRSPLFEDPLVLRWDALRRADWPAKATSAVEPFAVLLRDGSSLFAELVSVQDDALVVRSARHGETTLLRSEVISVHRIRGEHIAAAGPAGDARWRAVATEMGERAGAAPAVSPITAAAGGALAFPYWNRSAWMDCSLPPMVECDFRVSSSRTPDFRLSLAAGGNVRLIVETWAEDIVVRAGGDFRVVGHLGEADRDAAFRILWDTVQRKCLVFSPSGELVTEWTVPPDTNSSSARIILQNKGRDLVLEHLRVRQWSGNLPTKLRGETQRVELRDGRTLEGQIGGSAAGGVVVKIAEASEPEQHPLEAIDALIFSSAPEPAPNPGTTLTFTDGSVLIGQLTKADAGRAELVTSFTRQPLAVQLGGLTQLRREGEKDSAPKEDSELPDTLVLGGTTMRGRMVASGEAAPRWLPQGGVQPALPQRALPLEIRRTLPENAAATESAALIYTRTGDVLSGALTSFTRDAVEFRSDFTQQSRLPAESVDAIQFRALGAKSVEGFTDPGWQFIRGAGAQAPGADASGAAKLELTPGLAVVHPSVLHCPEVRFTMTANVYGSVRLRLFTAGAETAKSMSLIVASMGARIYWGVEGQEGQLQNQQQIVATASQPVAIALIIREKGFELHLNGVNHGWYAVPANRRAGTGLRLECAGIWGNEPSAVTISDFVARSGAGRAWLPDVNAEAKLHALTIPRFRQDNPPRHALLGFNGDVLRGEIDAMSATHFAFRSGLETLRVPRDRVCAAIRLKPPAAGAVAPPQASPAELVLDRIVSRNVQFNAEMRSILATLQSEMGTVSFKYPSERDPRRMFINFSGRTVGDVLDDVCSFYGLSYRVEGASIIVEKPRGTPEGLVARVYWVRPGAFADGAEVEKLLREKGVAFAERSSVAWDSAAARLSVTTSNSAHEQLARILSESFGPLHDPPTHWLLLTTGARIGFTSTRFAPDFVHGLHPVYGECRVPLSLVHTVRTSPPEATPAMKALANWQLIRASEPVLPATGGESSPTLGKAAWTFQLPLLGGGEFDLSKEKGKVVVLDFWATWCGPCIKSMPGLMEAMAALPADRVRFIAVNQSEPAEQVKRFLETRGWNLTVAMDGGQAVARKYGVEGIPHTVVIDAEGNIAWVKTGFSPTAATEAADAVRRLLEKPAAK